MGKAGVSYKSVIDYKLSRYACYLIVQNANPKFQAVALGQAYFAIQTIMFLGIKVTIYLYISAKISKFFCNQNAFINIKI